MFETPLPNCEPWNRLPCYKVKDKWMLTIPVGDYWRMGQELQYVLRVLGGPEISYFQCSVDLRLTWEQLHSLGSLIELSHISPPAAAWVCWMLCDQHFNPPAFAGNPFRSCGAEGIPGMVGVATETLRYGKMKGGAR